MRHYFQIPISRSLTVAIVCNPGNLSDLKEASSRYDMLFWSETLVSDLHHTSELLVPGFGRPVLLCRARCLGPEGWRNTNEMDMEHFAIPNLSVIGANDIF